MNSPRRKITPGEVWWAWQLWFTHDKANIEERAAHADHQGVAHIPVNRHPALILSQGDDKELGWLVCFFSTKPGTSKHPAKVLLGDVFDNGAANYLVNTAPQYCPSLFLVAPMLDKNMMEIRADPNLLNLVCAKMTWATKVRQGQSPGIALADVLCGWINKLPSEVERINQEESPDLVLNDANIDV